MPGQLRERLCTAGRGRRRRLDHEQRSALAEHEPVAVRTEWPAGVCRERAEPCEARERDARERVGAAGQHGVGPSEPDEVERVAEGVVAGRARSGEHGDPTAEAELGCDIPADLVRAGADELLGRDRAGPHVRGIPPLEPAALSHRRADRKGNACTRTAAEPRLRERLPPGGRREQRGAPGPRLARALELEAANLAADPGRKGRRVERLDLGRTCRSGEESRPEGLHVHADRRDDPEAGDYRPLDAASCSASRACVSATRLPKVVIPFSSSTVKLSP